MSPTLTPSQADVAWQGTPAGSCTCQRPEPSGEADGGAAGPIWRRVTRWDTVGSDRLSPQSVSLIIKRACRRAGIDDARYAGHSLRSGFSTAAGEAKAPERAIMRQTGHRSERMVRKYIRPASVFHENAGAWVNL